MPTPFMHLDYAEQLRRHPGLRPVVKEQIERELPAFYLGNIAADYQAICAIPRENTHFYSLPPPAGWQAHESMLAAYPQLAEPGRLEPAQAVFIAGYAYHLIQDLHWYWQVLIPYFMQSDRWPVEKRYRFISHNALLTYLDRLSLAELPPESAHCLALAPYQGWLPFAADQDIWQWQEMIVTQLRPGGNIATATIYANRMGIPAGEFIDNLNNPAWMQAHIFDLVPLEPVYVAMQQGVDEAVHWTNAYLGAISGRERNR